VQTENDVFIGISDPIDFTHGDSSNIGTMRGNNSPDHGLAVITVSGVLSGDTFPAASMAVTAKL
jgi:hypothetical protein